MTLCAVANRDSSSHGEAARVQPASDKPQPPAIFLDTRLIKPTGRRINVTGGALGAKNLQRALTEAAPGDAILLEAGAVFSGNFTLPAKNGDGWITIASSELSQLPPPDMRVSPADARLMPKLVSPNSGPALATAPAAHHYRLIGIEFAVSKDVDVSYGLVALGSGGNNQASLDQVPHDLIIDRCYIHGNTGSTLRRGVALNSARSAIIDSYISECKEAGADSQAICGWNGPGPFKIVNNYLEGAGENVMFGGAEPKISELVPSDIEFRGNHCYKPLAWKSNDSQFAGKRWTVKNLFELKNARRVLVEGNLFENNWADAQTGYAILFTVRSQGAAAPWTVVEDVTFTGNIVRHASGAVNILGRDRNNPSRQAGRISIRNNLFEDISSASRGGDGTFLKITDAADVSVDHNTVINSGSIIAAYGAPNANFTFTNNRVQHNRYGVKGDGKATGNSTIEAYFPDSVFRRNVMAGGRSDLYPQDNLFPAQAANSQESSHARQSMSDGSAVTEGTDGKKVGCDMDALKPALDAADKARSQSYRKSQ